MATTNIDGSPNIAARLDFTGASGGDFTVEDYNGGAPITLLTVRNSGTLNVTSKITKAGPVEIMNETSGASGMLDLYTFGTVPGATKRMEFSYDSGSSTARIKASTSGHNIELEADSIRLNTTTSTGTITSFRTSGAERLYVTWDSGTSKARIRAANHIEIENAASADTDIEVVASRHAVLRFGTNGTGELRVMDPSNTYRMTSVSENGVWTLRDAGNLGAIVMTPYDAATTPTSEIAVGNDGTRGLVYLLADLSGTTCPGAVKFQPQDITNGTYVWLYVWYGTKDAILGTHLIAKSSDPVATPGSGTRLASF